MKRKRPESRKPRDCCAFRLDAVEEGFVQCLNRPGLLMIFLARACGCVKNLVGALGLGELPYGAVSGPLQRLTQPAADHDPCSEVA